MFVEALPEGTRRNLALLADAGLAEPYHLAGGTAAALHLGHRLSIDLDFFGPLPFDAAELAGRLSDLGEFRLDRLPQMLVKASWSHVKRFFESGARALLKGLAATS